MRGTPSVTPSVLAGSVRSPDLVSVPVPDERTRAADTSLSRGDLLTVDPDDRRRRARIALLELSIARTTERRRAV